MIVESGIDKNKNLMAISITNELLTLGEKPVFLCVGSDKVIGDSLGVLVGELLKTKYKINGYIYGDLDCPVTAKNLKKTIVEIKNNHPKSAIILIDSMLGDISEVGQIKFYKSGAIPGGEFNKGILIGDYSILAVVNVKGIDSLNFINSVKLTDSDYKNYLISLGYYKSNNLLQCKVSENLKLD